MKNIIIIMEELMIFGIPIVSNNGYSIGDVVLFKGKYYISMTYL